MSLDENQCHEVSKALFDIGKLAFGIAVATPLVTSGLRGWVAALGGGVFVVTVFMFATRLARKEKT